MRCCPRCRILGSLDVHMCLYTEGLVALAPPKYHVAEWDIQTRAPALFPFPIHAVDSCHNQWHVAPPSVNVVVYCTLVFLGITYKDYMQKALRQIERVHEWTGRTRSPPPASSVRPEVRLGLYHQHWWCKKLNLRYLANPLLIRATADRGAKLEGRSELRGPWN